MVSLQMITASADPNLAASAVVLAAIGYVLVWTFGDREARESTAVAAVPVIGFVVFAILAGVLSQTLVAQNATPDVVFDLPCDTYWWFGLPWCWGW